MNTTKQLKDFKVGDEIILQNGKLKGVFGKVRNIQENLYWILLSEEDMGVQACILLAYGDLPVLSADRQLVH